MALVACRECGKQVSDQAETCPNCGIRSPSAPTSQKSPSVETDDEILLNKGNIIITRTLAKFPSQTFPINGIGSVTLVPPKIVGLLLFGAILALFGVVALSNGGGGGGMFFLAAGFITICVAFSKKHGLFIKTASSDIRAMQGDEKTLETVKQAIERAATMRG